MRIPFIVAVTFISGIYTTPTYAENSLSDACSHYGGEMIISSRIANYNVTTIDSDLNLRLSGHTSWYTLKLNNKNFASFFEMITHARITGEKVDLCVNDKGHYLLGIEWSNGRN